MSVYSTNFFQGVLPTSLGTLYTVPAGTVAVLRDIELANGTSGTSNPSINTTVAGSTCSVYLPGNIVQFAWVQWTGRVVVPAGGLIQGQASLAGFQAIISGYLLS